MRRAGHISVGVALAAAFYMLLIDTVDLPELAAAAVVVALAGLAHQVSLQKADSEVEFEFRWLRRAWRPLAGVPRQILLVSREALLQLVSPRRERGRFRAVPFRAGSGERGHGRVAMAEGFGSLAPNTIVIGVDPETGLLLVHQLHVTGDRRELDVLELG